MAEISTKPYLIRAIYEWCTDNGYRPYIAVAVDERTIVPREFVRNGEIVLNVSAMATNRLQMGNELVEFEARFGGSPRQVSIPVENISAIFAQENGHGMAFEVPKALGLTPADAQQQADGLADDEGAADAHGGQPPSEANAAALDGAAGAPRFVLASDSGSSGGSGGGPALDGSAAAADAGAGADAPPVARAPSRRRRPKLAAVPTSTPADSAAPAASQDGSVAPGAAPDASAAAPAPSAQAPVAAPAESASSGSAAPSSTAPSPSAAPAAGSEPDSSVAPKPARSGAVSASSRPASAGVSDTADASDASAAPGSRGAPATPGDDEPPPPPAGRPRLTRVK